MLLALLERAGVLLIWLSTLKIYQIINENPNKKYIMFYLV